MSSLSGHVVRSLAPLVFVLLVLAGLFATAGELANTSAPDLGFFGFQSDDGLALFSGYAIYADPDTAAYTGGLYTPGLAVAVAVLDHVWLWLGWGQVLAMAAVTALGVAAARLAWRPDSDRWEAIGALGVGALAVWMASTVFGTVYYPAPDQPAWACALIGLLCAASAHTSRRSFVAAVVGLSLGFWTKQTALVASVAVAVWLAAMVVAGRRDRGFAFRFLTVLLACNVGVLGVLNAMTGGWELYFNFLLPQHHSRIHGVSEVLRDLPRVLGVATVVAGALLLAGARGWRRLDENGEQGLLLIVALGVAVPAAMLFRSKQGGDVNQYMGPAWVLALLAALGWRRARERVASALAADAVIAVIALAAVGGQVEDARHLTLVGLRTRAKPIDAQLANLAKTRLVYDPLLAHLNVGTRRKMYQSVFNLSDLLASGRQPRGLVRDLLARRFDAVVPFRTAIGSHIGPLDNYASAYGRREAGYFWKLDRLIDAGYGPGGLPRGALRRRSGLSKTGELASCFGPFDIAGARFDIRAGGGLWCRSGRSLLMRDSPAARSEIVTRDSVTARGEILLTGDVGAAIEVGLPSGRRVDVRRGTRGWRVATGGGEGVTVVRKRVVRLVLGGGARPGNGVGTVRVAEPSRARGALRVVANPRRAVRIDLSRLRVSG